MKIVPLRVGSYAGFRGIVKEVEQDPKRRDWCYIKVEDPLGEISSIHMNRHFLEDSSMPVDPAGLYVEMMISTADKNKGQMFPYDIMRMVSKYTAMSLEMDTKDKTVTRVVEKGVEFE